MPRLSARLGAATMLLSGAISTAGCASRAPEPADAGDPPRLVVFVVADQLADWVLDEHAHLLPPDSIIRRTLEEGRAYTVAFPYAVTATAAGHATLVTGVTPAEHGAFANEVWDGAVGRRKIVDDRHHRVLGREDRYASPSVLRVPGVADRLKAATGGRSVVVSISHKARASILTAGRSGDLAVFWDDDLGAMTTSVWYRPTGRLPDWLDRFNREHDLDHLFRTWTPALPDGACANDQEPGEGPFLGWDNTFPYDPAESEEPGKAFAYTPAATTQLFDLARIAVGEEGMGRDAVPDLLVLGVSATDKIGHVWGPRSCEYLDNLLHMDRELTAFARELAARMPVAFVLTADHGVAPLPEQANGGGRIARHRVLETARRAAHSTLGPGDWIGGYTGSMLYLTPAGDAHRSLLLQPVAEALGELPGIRRVYRIAGGSGDRFGTDPLDRLVAASLPPDAEADLLVVPERGWFNDLSDVPGGGANHGTPWEYDREVPLLIWGTGSGRIDAAPTDARDVAGILSKLLGIDDYRPPPETVRASR